MARHQSLTEALEPIGKAGNAGPPLSFNGTIFSFSGLLRPMIPKLALKLGKKSDLHLLHKEAAQILQAATHRPKLGKGSKFVKWRQHLRGEVRKNGRKFFNDQSH